MRHSVRIFTCLLTLLLFPLLLEAQTPAADIRPTLKSLTQAQKLQLLEYLRFLGADMEKEIQYSYEQLARKDQFKAERFIESMKQKKVQNALTTVSWNRDTLFFQNIPEGTPLLDSFLVTNTGAAPYLIRGTETTCDCTVLRVPEHPVMPGETAVLRFEFNTSEKLGSATPAIILYDNSSPNKRNILYLKGNIIPRKKPHKYPWED